MNEATTNPEGGEQSAPAGSRGLKFFRWGFPPIILVFIAAAYAGSLNGAFVLDDLTLNPAANPTISHVWPLGLFQETASSIATVNQLIFLRPVANATFTFNYVLGGWEPGGYHILNILIHMACALLVYGIVRRTLLTPVLKARYDGAPELPALIVALLWGLHPLLTQAVTYIYQRQESLMALFYLLTLYGWIRGAQDKSARWLAAAVASAFLGISTKQVMATVPAVIFLYDGIFLAGSWSGALKARKWAYLGLVLSVLWVGALYGWAALSDVPINVTGGGVSVRGAVEDRWTYLATMPSVIDYYLRLVAWPAPLVFDYQWPAATTFSAIFWPLLPILLVLAATVYGLARKSPWAFASAFWFIVLAPSSSVIPLLDDYIFEYRAYLPSLAPIAAVVIAGAILLRRWQSAPGRTRPAMTISKALAALLAAGLCLSFGVLTYLRNNTYRTAESIYRDTTLKAPNNSRAWEGLGEEVLQQGRTDEALAAFRTALAIYPQYAGASINIGTILFQQNHLAEAERAFEQPVADFPENAGFHYQLGNFYENAGQRSKAIEQYNRVVALNDGTADMALHIGKYLLPDGCAAALPAYRLAVRLGPQSAVAHNNLGVCLMRTGQPFEAVYELQRAVALDPGFTEAADNLARMAPRAKGN